MLEHQKAASPKLPTVAPRYTNPKMEPKLRGWGRTDTCGNSHAADKHKQIEPHAYTPTS
jgi:hypothetical protein